MLLFSTHFSLASNLLESLVDLWKEEILLAFSLYLFFLKLHSFSQLLVRERRSLKSKLKSSRAYRIEPERIRSWERNRNSNSNLHVVLIFSSNRDNQIPMSSLCTRDLVQRIRKELAAAASCQPLVASYGLSGREMSELEDLCCAPNVIAKAHYFCCWCDFFPLFAAILTHILRPVSWYWNGLANK